MIAEQNPTTVVQQPKNQPQNCFYVYSTALKALVGEIRKVHNWLSDHTQKEQSMQGRLIYSLIVMDLSRELTDFEKRADAYEEAGNKNKIADQETIEFINRTSNGIHAALREWKSEHQPDDDFDVVIDQHSMGSFLKVLKRLNEMNDVEETNKLRKVLVNGVAGGNVEEKTVQLEPQSAQKQPPKNGKRKQNGKRKRNDKQKPQAQQEPLQAPPGEPKSDQQCQQEDQPEPQ
ncbi:Protein CBG27940 [Caenorhabditis briggsae]|uniref:Protein CBG27940 n=2 Tax=Caenorhabditis briggsae TaxID=6238 RepID=B6IJN2_CAEBR|nr:Protein CBG27940 [Caenorhabditis briggsae]ULT83786.1 hypothetical protein L3Y34_012808 [Caenorhabditis briggsae]CAS00112.1 Protein CBG27940 [Caenorhabditis briggsae]